ncbi:hypothetical protein FGO68_gene2536 [Halteria grandinella]|uniref:Signal transduction histidine kinase dimerisation/phosphoacceptor domain-containing protein n=1 Tax=Halteria grandinella TaxID=5974 RepID=A0A8J8P2C6_HALGN|nr:hypothetical protein FGO68_gene2536 [Halteria grandinella]
MLTSTNAKNKNIQRLIIWSYYILRNFQYYGFIQLDLLGHITFCVMFQEMSTQVYDTYISSIKEQTLMVQETFQNTLDIVPNGVLIYDINSKRITFANQEMCDIVGKQAVGADPIGYESLQDKICLFSLYNKMSLSDADSDTNFSTKDCKQQLNQSKIKKRESSSSGLLSDTKTTSKPRNLPHRDSILSGNSTIGCLSTGSKTSAALRMHPNSKSLSKIDERSEVKVNLWQFILAMQDAQANKKTEAVFKARDPKKYIQVKTTLINGGAQIIAFCSDITKIKEVEVQGQKMRATFFSSVAHELRTPLNSIIPILKLIIDMLPTIDKERLTNFMQVVLNSSLHLQSVIEDALDIRAL